MLRIAHLADMALVRYSYPMDSDGEMAVEGKRLREGLLQEDLAKVLIEKALLFGAILFYEL